MVIHWKDDYIFEAPSHRTQGVPGNGVLMDATAPFKGVCHQCGKRTIVRHYPYNMLEWFGTYCPDCFEDISNGISSGGVFVADDSI